MASPHTTQVCSLITFGHECRISDQLNVTQMVVPAQMSTQDDGAMTIQRAATGRTPLRAFVLFAIASLVMLAVPTSANAALSQCPAGYFCSWGASNYQGEFIRDVGRTSCGNIGTTWGIESVYNRTSLIQVAYSGINCTGQRATLYPGGKLPYFVVNSLSRY